MTTFVISLALIGKLAPVGVLPVLLNNTVSASRLDADHVAYKVPPCPCVLKLADHTTVPKLDPQLGCPISM